MKFTCSKEDILYAVGKAEKAVSPKSTLAVMEGILVEARNNTVCLTGNDLEISIEASFEADVVRPGRIVLNSRTFGDIVRKCGGETVEFDVGDKYKTTIVSGNSVFEILGINADEFPDNFEFDIDNSITIEAIDLKAMIRQTIFATSKGEFRQILTGELFKVEGDYLKVVALDGHRLAIRKEKLVKSSPLKDFIMPFKTLNELLKIIGDDETVEIFPSKKYIMLEFGGCRLYSRVIDGEFINYEKIVNNECPIKIRANAKKLKHSFERVSPIIYNETVKSPVKLNIVDNVMIIDCATLSGKIHDEAPIEKLYGNNLEIGFTNQYLLDAFGGCDEEVFLEFSTPLSPLVISPVEGDKFLYIILPVRLRK